MSCNTKDFRYPLQAQIYYPIINQSAYGNVEKQWSFDKTLPCSLSVAGSSFKEEIDPKVLLTQSSLLIGRFRTDIRINSFGESFDTTNILVTNIVDKNCNLVYKETSGPRNNQGTLYEVATHQPFLDPFGNIEFYRVILRRSENQGVDV